MKNQTACIKCTHISGSDAMLTGKTKLQMRGILKTQRLFRAGFFKLF